MKEKLIETGVLLPPPSYRPENYKEQLFGIGTMLSFSAGVPLMLVSSIFAAAYPEAYYGVIGGAGLIAASVPGILYFTTIALDSAVHH